MDNLLTLSLVANIILAFVLVVFYFFIKRLSKGKKDYVLFEGKIKEAEKLLSDSRERADDTLKTAAKKAEEIIENSNFLRNDIEGDFEKSLDALFEEIKKETKISFDKASQGFSEEARKDMVSFSKNLLLETEGLKGAVSEGISQAIKNMEGELEEYKKLKMGEIEKMVAQKVDSLSKEVLGKSLSEEDNFKLALNSLEKATKNEKNEL